MTDDTNKTPTYITLGEAAKRTGLSKATISRMIKSGKISVREKGEDGAFRIDPSEIIRFMDAARVQRATSFREDDDTNVPPQNGTETLETSTEKLLESLPFNVLRRLLDAEGKADQLAVCRDEIEKRVALLQAQLEEMRGHYDELKQQRDSWQAQAERLLLTYQAPAVATPQPPAQAERRGVLGWFRRAG